MEQLSAKQARVLDFIKSHLQHTGYPPTVREIADKLGLAGPNSAKKFLDILERKGFIRRQPGCSRAIEIMGCRCGPQPFAACRWWAPYGQASPAGL